MLQVITIVIRNQVLLRESGLSLYDEMAGHWKKNNCNKPSLLAPNIIQELTLTASDLVALT